MQKQYWSSDCHNIGYALRRNKKLLEGYSAEDDPLSVQSQGSGHMADADRSCSGYKRNCKKGANGLLFSSTSNRNATSKFGKKIGISPPSRVHGKSPSEDDGSKSDIPFHPHDERTNNFASAERTRSSSAPQTSFSLENTEREQQNTSVRGMNDPVTGVKVTNGQCNGSETDAFISTASRIKDLEKENHELKERLMKVEGSKMLELQFERDRAKALEAQV